MENEEKDIIQQFADKLRDSEIPYREGAWERFAAKEAGSSITVATAATSAGPAGTTIRSLIRPWMGVAAAILLAAGAGWFYLASRGPDQKGGAKALDDQLVVTKKSDTSPLTKAANAGIAKTDNMDRGNGIDENNNTKIKTGDRLSAFNNNLDKNRDNRQLNNRIVSGNVTETGASFGLPFSFPYTIEQAGVMQLNGQFSASDKAAATAISNNALAAIDAAHQPIKPGLHISPAGTLFSLSAATPGQQISDNTVIGKDKPNPENNKPAHNTAASGTATALNTPSTFDDKGYFNLEDASNNRKWDMGVMVIPAVSNDSKLNVGYGVSVGYNISKRLSINSGLAYTQLTGSKTPDQQQATISSGGRMLSSIDARANGLNVPLEIRYHVSQKIYVGTGISGMALLSDKVERHYAIASMQTSAFEARNGQALKPDAMQSIASNIQKKEVIPQDQLGSKDFAGFINFTFGFKQPLNKSKSISIEPFISVPMSNHVFNQNIKLTDGGIRIKLGL